MFTNDIIGSSHADDGKVDRGRVRLFAEGVPEVKEMSDELRTLVRTGGENDTPTRELARFIKEHAERDVTGMKVDLICRRDRYLRGGDHAPFLNAGYAAVRFTEPAENFHHQHQNVARSRAACSTAICRSSSTSAYIAQVARVNAAALAALALAPGAPRGVADRDRQARERHHAALGRQPRARPRRLSHRVARDHRAAVAEPQGRRQLVTQVTMPVSKDNVVFGVQAIDKDGNVSVASFPTPFRPATPPAKP